MWRKKIRYGVEGTLILFALLFFRLITLDGASALGGWLGRRFGPLSRAHRTAKTNLAMAMPEKDEYERDVILNDMWDNLGRVMGEYPHLARPIMKRRIFLEGVEHLEAVKASGRAALFVSGHFANWETIPLTSALYGLPLAVIYRVANNPVAERFTRYIRGHYSRAMFNKGRTGAAESLKVLKSGHPLAMLVDQKQNDGSAVMFFGRPAMTATALAVLSLKFKAPILAAHAVRLKGVNFRVTLEAPKLYPPGTDPLQIMTEINQLLEGWIREHPAQWFWVHRRWG